MDVENPEYQNLLEGMQNCSENLGETLVVPRKIILTCNSEIFPLGIYTSKVKI